MFAVCLYLYERKKKNLEIYLYVYPLKDLYTADIVLRHTLEMDDDESLAACLMMK